MTDTRPTRDAPAERPPRPRTIDATVGLLVLTAVAALASAGALFTIKSWVADQVVTAARKNKQAIPADPLKTASSVANNQLVVGIVMAVMLCLVALLAWRGRYWVRWAVLGLYVLATISGSFVGIGSIVSVVSSEPLVFKVPTFIGALAFLGSLVLINMRSSAMWLAFGRPAPVAGRGGLFGPRPARTGTTARTGPGGRPAGGGLFGRPAPARDTVVDARPVKVETTSSRAEPKGRRSTGATGTAGATSATASRGGKPDSNRPAARGKGSAKSRRS